MARQAPGPCGTCGFFLPLAGSLRQSFGACGNVYAPADGRVVTVDYGCGAHSQATLAADDATEVVRSARYDTGEDTSIGPSSAKLFCTEMVGRAVDRAVQVHGGLGYLRTTPVERFYRDARLYRLYEGTSEVQRVIIGGGLLRDAGMPRG